ncbi:MAG: glycosyltransferase [Candidatus Omnitrophica bacterium]|nr:glycosyltransferase [Candidatus Omnitrophota bacterium]
MLKNQTIICLSTIDWHYAKQRHQILMEKFAQNGNQVIFVEHLGFSPQRLTDLANIYRRVLRALVSSKSIRSQVKLIPNLQIITPLVLPPQNKLFNFINKHLFLKLLAKKLRELADKQPIVWTYLATTTAVNLIDKLNPKILIYDCVYDALRHPEAPKDIAASEQKILAKADIVLTDALYFYNHKKNYNQHVHQIPPGVDFKHFNQPAESGKPLMADIKSPRICFFGCMGRGNIRIDFDLLEFIAKEKPQWSFVNIGPLVNMEVPKNLACLDNIKWLGFISYTELPQYLGQCDVLILPYQLNDFTESVLPAKVFECLATGKPVVSTALPELKPYKQYFFIAEDKQEFLAGIEAGLNNDSEEKKQQRMVFARSNTWEARFESICRILNHKLIQ